MSNPKEPTFFCKKENLNKLNLYESYFRQSDINCNARCIIDGSTAYMVDPEVPGRIHETLGDDLYFIFSLRKPADRTISAFWQMAKKGYEHRAINDALTFESTGLEAVIMEEEEKTRMAVKSGLIDISTYVDRYDDPLWNFRYIRNSHYRPDLERYLKIFPRERIKIVLFDHLADNTMQELRQIAQFLGVDPNLINAGEQTRYNPARLPRGGNISKKIISVIRAAKGRAILRKLPGFSVLYNFIYSSKIPAVDKKIIRRITALFHPELDSLSGLIQHDLQMWK